MSLTPGSTSGASPAGLPPLPTTPSTPVATPPKTNAIEVVKDHGAWALRYKGKLYEIELTSGGKKLTNISAADLQKVYQSAAAILTATLPTLEQTFTDKGKSLQDLSCVELTRDKVQVKGQELNETSPVEIPIKPSIQTQLHEINTIGLAALKMQSKAPAPQTNAPTGSPQSKSTPSVAARTAVDTPEKTTHPGKTLHTGARPAKESPPAASKPELGLKPLSGGGAVVPASNPKGWREILLTPNQDGSYQNVPEDLIAEYFEKLAADYDDIAFVRTRWSPRQEWVPLRKRRNHEKMSDPQEYFRTIFGEDAQKVLKKKHCLIPINWGNSHWVLVHIDRSDTNQVKITYYDPKTAELSTDRNAQLEKMGKVLNQLFVDAGQPPLFTNANAPHFTQNKKNLSRQKSDYECGIFIMAYAKGIAEKKALTDTYVGSDQQSQRDWREHIAKKIAPVATT